MEGEDPHSREDPGRSRWLPHLTRATTWLLATVAATVIGVVVPGLIGGWLPGLGDDDESDVDTDTTTVPRAPQVSRSRLVTSEKVGLFNVELSGNSNGAINVHGQPKRRDRDGLTCVMEWPADGLKMDFYNLGGEDPCVYGSFCWAEITGSEWATSAGLRVDDRTRRMLSLYPRAEYVEEPGVVRRYVLEPATAPCGDAEGGLEAWTATGRVFALRVSFRAGGD